MKNILYSYKNRLDVLSLFLYAVIVFIFISIIGNNFDLEVLLGLEFLVLVIVYFTRYNAVNIDFYDDYMCVNFYILKKKFLINYDQIIELKECRDRFIGSNTRFKIKHLGKLIIFRIKTSDVELKKHLKHKAFPTDSLKV
jgi:hypothetical protein